MAIITPIWRDAFHTLATDGSSVPFRIYTGDENQPTQGGLPIYEGLCSPRPDGRAVIRLNDIAADYLTHTIPNLGDAAFTALTFPVYFYIFRYTNGAWSWDPSDDCYAFLLDWSYDPDYTTADGLAFPVDGVISRNQYLLFTALNVPAISADLTYDDGTHDTVTIQLAHGADFDASFNRDFARSLQAAGSGTAVFRPSAYDTPAKRVVAISVNGVDYDVVDPCERYVLYYLNAYGGWDSLLVQGHTRRTDTLERSTLETAYDNNGITTRGIRDYAIGITRGYTFNTHILSDLQSERMHHLLESPDVYFHDLDTDTIRPLVLTGSDCVFQDYRSNGARMSQYEIAAKVAQAFERR